MISNNKIESLKNILKSIFFSTSSNFYQEIYNKSGFILGEFIGPEDMKKITQILYEDFIRVDLRSRIYFHGGEEGNLVKIISEHEKPFLIQRSARELGNENYVSQCNRPQILLSNAHEALEKSLCFYENNTLPLIGQPNNLFASSFSAKKYEMDLLLTEPDLFKSYISILKKDFDISKLNVTLIDDDFNLETILSSFPFIENLRFALDLPETGSFAESCPEALRKGELIFHPDKNSILETNGGLIVTKLIKMPTPIIRYQTEILVEPVDKKCSCKEETCFRFL
jgi:hypothetical protein